MSSEDFIRIIEEFRVIQEPSLLTQILQVTQIATFIVATVSLIVVIINVNRTQKKSRENDEEKFKRDLNLKASDEIIEAINAVKASYGDIIGIKVAFKHLTSYETDLASFLNHLKRCMVSQHESTLQMVTKYKQREIILEQYDEEIEFVYNLGTDTVQKIKTILNFYTINAGHTDNETNYILDQLYRQAQETIVRLNLLQKRVQNDFLGELYRKH